MFQQIDLLLMLQLRILSLRFWCVEIILNWKKNATDSWVKLDPSKTSLIQNRKSTHGVTCCVNFVHLLITNHPTRSLPVRGTSTTDRVGFSPKL